MDLRAEVESLLQRLGGSADDVAAYLRANGVKGIRNALRHLNPVVRYVQISVKTEAVEFDVMKADVLRITYMRRHEEVAIPEPVWQFLFNFNRGGYPELDSIRKSVDPVCLPSMSLYLFHN